MKTWHKIAVAAAGLAVVIIALVALVFYATSGLTDTGTRFFQAVRAGDYEAAYALTSQELQRDNSLEELKAYVEGNGFDTVIESSWSSRSMSGNTGELSGTLTTESGRVVPVEIRLVNEPDGWKINAIERDIAGLSDGASQTMPPVTVQQSMAFSDTRRFASSLGDDDFAFFLPEWVDMMTEPELSGGFAQFRPDRQRIVDITAQPPTITSAEFTDEGLLRLRGYFANEAGRYEFEYDYAGHDGDAKLYAFTFRLI